MKIVLFMYRTYGILFTNYSTNHNQGLLLCLRAFRRSPMQCLIAQLMSIEVNLDHSTVYIYIYIYGYFESHISLMRDCSFVCFDHFSSEY